MATPSAVQADGLARAALFGETTLAENTEVVLQRVRALPTEQQFDALARWVLPGAEHSGLRLTGHFLDIDQPTRDGKSERGFGQRGSVASPAIALVDVAAQTGRLEELKAALEQVGPKLADQQRQRAFLALQLLVDVARADDAAAVETLTRLFDLFAATAPEAINDRWPEMVALECSLGVASTRTVAAELLTRMFELLVTDSGGWKTRATPEWTAHFLRQLAALEPDSDAEATDGEALTNWQPATLEKARTAGVRLPQAEWRVGSQSQREASRTVAHEDDLLFYACPLQGDFEVECDLQPYVWDAMQLLIGRQSLAPDGDRFGLDIRGIRASEVRHVGLPRQLSVSDEWAHLRAVVRGSECRLYFDGRLIETRQVNLTSVPWLALRNPVPHRGAVRDVRISGSPRVPREISLAADEQLDGWFSWFETDDTAWRQSRNWPRETGIERDRLPELSGSALESLLQYYRPVLEDGTITYEFLYEPGEFEVHPALGRTVVLLQPDGIALHRATCGRYEPSEVSPDNRSRPSDAGDAVRPLPLQAGRWNQVSVTVAGDVFRVTLNGNVVCEAPIDATEQRTFGLFHWADQTSVRVRNIVWRGSWPDAVPDVEHQEFADATVAMLDRTRQNLVGAFDHDFAEGGMPEQLFVTQGSDQQAALEQRADGLHMARPVREKGYSDVWAALHMRVYGDFDIEARFDGMSCTLPSTGWQGINLEVVTEDDGFTHCRAFRGTFFNAGRIVTDLVQAQVHGRLKGEYRAHVFGSVPEEAASGRLRIARRGDRLYFLLAQHDSPQYRLLHEDAVSDAGLIMEGIRLRLNAVTEADGAAEHSVVWKSLSVRAETISDLPILNAKQIIADLDQRREQLTDRLGGETAGNAAWLEGTYTGGTVSNPGDDDFQIRGVGSNRWTSSRVGFLPGVSGDFDASVTFTPTRFDNPAEGQQSAIYLRGTIPGPENTNADLVLVRYPDGRQIVLAELMTLTRNGPKFRDLAVQQVKSVERLRLVRRGTKLTFLYSEKADDEFQVLAQTDIPADDLRPRSFRFEVQSGGEGKTIEVDVKEFSLRAEKLVKQSQR